MSIKSAFGIGAATLALAVSLVACGSNSNSMSDTAAAASAATSSSSMASDKMSADSMASDSMASDKMASDKMSADSMASDSMASDKMASDKMSADMMASDMMAKQGTFAGLNGKQVSGTAKVEGHTLTLSDFSSDEGPDLHVYLANGTDEAAITAGKQIAAVKFDAASQTFDLTNLHPGNYTDIVVYCNKAKAVFGAASLS